MSKYGSLFEDACGPPMIRVKPTYNFDPVTGRVDRGLYLPAPEAPLFTIRGHAVYASSLSAYAIVVEAVKLGMYATLLVGIRSDKSYAQIAGLSAITLAHLAYVNVVRPFAAPHDTFIVLLGDVADLGTFACAFLLLITNGQDDQFRRSIGIAMIVLELVALVAYVLERLSRCWRAVARILLPELASRLGWRQIPGEDLRARVRAVVYEAIRNDPNLLARMYGDRWMLRALGRGLAARPLGRSEQSFRRVLAKSTRRKVRRTTSGLGMGTLLQARVGSEHSSVGRIGSASSGSSAGRGGSGPGGPMGSMLDVW